MINAIVLCSGGIDSAATAFYVKKRLKYDYIKILFFSYGQRNLKGERICSKRCAEDLNADFIEINIDYLGEISTSLLNSEKISSAVTINDLKNSNKESKKWYVPCRNLVFLSNTFALAEAFYIKDNLIYDIFVGFKNDGKENYPDTTQSFLNSLNKVSNLSCIGKYKVSAPFINKDKEDIILTAEKLGVEFNRTFSCYVGSKEHCGVCLACRLRQEGFYWANVKDPTKYKSQMKDFRIAKN